MKTLMYLSIIFILTSCDVRTKSRCWYHMLIKNDCSENVSDVILKYKKANFEFGIIGAKVDAKYSFVGEKHPLPDKATVEWQSKDGKIHKKIIEIKSQVPKSFEEITIILTITPDNEVSVSYKNE